MKKKRLIPVLLLRNGQLVQSKSFSRYQNLGNPYTAVKRLSEWAADELIYLDISRDDDYDLRRDDLKQGSRGTFLDIIDEVSRHSFMPLTVGGRIRTLKDIEQRLTSGADKVSINTMALIDPSFIESAAREFGEQCIVISIDVRTVDSQYRVYSASSDELTGRDLLDWAREAEGRGAGEMLVNSVDRDGAKTGYDLTMLQSVSSSVKIPVIALGGVGEWNHLAEGLRETQVDAVAAANVFHYTDQSVYLAKKFLYDRELPVRKPFIIKLESNRK